MADAPRKLSHYFTHSKRKGRAGLPLMSVTMHDGLVRRDSLDRKTDSALKDDEHLLVEPSDIAYNMMRMWQGALGLADEAANVSPAYGVMRPKNTVDPRFAKHWFKSDRGLYMLWAYSYGLTEDRLRLYPKEFLRVPVDWPSRQRQSKIADVLDHWDQAIAIVSATIERREALRRAVARTVFPLKRDFGALERPSKFCVGDLGRIIRGISYDPNEDLADEGVGVLTAAHVLNGEVTLLPSWNVVRSAATQPAQLMRAGDFLIAMSNGSKALVGKAGLMRSDPAVPLGAGAFCATLRPRDALSRRVLDHAFGSERYKELLHVELAGSSIGNLTAGDLRGFEFYWSGDESELAVLDGLRLLIRKDTDRLVRLQLQKRAIMQQLFPDEHPQPVESEMLT